MDDVTAGAKAFLDEAISGPLKRPLPFIAFADVAPSLDANDFVEGVLTAGTMSVLYGESNCGKTFLALDLALHVAQGRTWFGREVTQGPVLYLALEGGNGIRNRIVAYRSTHDLDDANLPFALVSQSLNLRDPEGDLAAILATAKALLAKFEAPLAFIVVDTLSRAMAGANENAPEDMTALVAVGDQLRQATGAHCMWVHHSGKDQARGARGHTSLRAATDTEIEVIAEGADRRAEVKKQRDLTSGDVFRFTLQSVELGKNQRDKPVTSCIVRPADGDDQRSVDPARKLSGHAKRAYEVLGNTLAEEGMIGFTGVPAGIPSVPDPRWREQFYGAAMPGADAEARKHAFRRASVKLVELRLVAMNGGRVWLTSHQQPEQSTGA